MSYKCTDIAYEKVPGRKTLPLHEHLWAKVMAAPVGVTMKFKIPKRTSTTKSVNRSDLNYVNIWNFFKHYRAQEIKCTVNRQGPYVLITKISN